jgi:hypothetical protein
LAKRRGRPPGSGKMAAAAETVGSSLGSLMARVDSWVRQRDQLVSDLRAMADNIASGGKATVGSALQAAGLQETPKAEAKKRRSMSPEARARIAQAQRDRWAKQKAEQGIGGSAKKAKKAKKSA